MKNQCPKCRGEGYYWSDDGELGENEWKCERCKGAGRIDSIRPEKPKPGHASYLTEPKQPQDLTLIDLWLNMQYNKDKENDE